MIVVAIMALLVAIAVPNFLRARKRSEAVRILDDLRILDHATDHYALETSKPAGFTLTMYDLRNYVKTGTELYSTGADLFGNAYGPFTVDSPPKLSGPAFNALSDVADPSFWSPYY
jgi:type II secretory pathway pseudopilin PulG